MDMSEAVAMRLKELCAARNMSLYELAYRSGVPESTLRHMADGEKGSRTEYFIRPTSISK